MRRYPVFIGPLMAAFLPWSGIAISNTTEGELGKYLIQLRDRNPYLREDAAEALGDMKEKRAVDALIASLKDPSREVRRASAWALGRIGDPKAIEPLLKVALGDTSSEVRREAARALSRIEQFPTSQFYDALKEKRVDRNLFVILEYIGRKDPKLIHLLIPHLGSEDADIRGEAARILVRIGRPAVPQLILSLKDGNPRVRENACWALGCIREPKAVEPLIDRLKDEHPDVRSCAAWALGIIRDKRAVKYLMESLEDRERSVCESAIWALGKLRDPKAVDSLIPFLKSKDMRIRRATTWALGKIGDKRAVEPLILALKDEDQWVRGNASSSLGEIGDERAIEPLSKIMRTDSSEEVREKAKKALEMLRLKGRR